MSNINYEQLLSVLPCGIFTFNNNGTIVFVNDTLLQKLNYKLSDLVGSSIESIYTLSTRIFHQTHFFPLLRLQTNAGEIFLTLRAKNGDDIPVLVNAVQTVLNGETINVCACITIYQRKQYEQEILLAKRAAEEANEKNEALQKVKQELENDRETLDRQVTKLKYRNEELAQLSNIFTHELQEPVRKVSLFTDVLGSDASMINGEKARSLIDIILQSSHKMRKLLRGVQEFLFLNVEKIQVENVDLSQLIKQEFQLVSERFADVDVSFSVTQIPIIEGDAKQLSTLFNELLSNCFLCRHEERKLVINIECATVSENVFNSIEGKYRFDDFLQISIQDNGNGFDQDTELHIFKILKKLDVTSEGIGMGLAVCKKIVENHNGKITAVGQNGVGAKFVLLLPLPSSNN